VLPGSGDASIEGAFRLATERGGSVLILSLGYPQTPRQELAVRQAMERAWETGVRMEAVLLLRRREIRRYLVAGDDLLE
jgi:hypothetical protein